jgi:hypothetical protein
MQDRKQDYLFSTNVSDSTDVNEFVIEFFPGLSNTQAENLPSKVTHTFDELIDFIDQMDES